MSRKAVLSALLILSLSSSGLSQIESFIPDTDSLYVLGIGCIGPSIWPVVDSTNPGIDTIRLDGFFNVGHLDPYQLPNDSTRRLSCAFVVKDSSNRFTYQVWFDPESHQYAEPQQLLYGTWNGIPLGRGAIVLKVYDHSLLVDTMKVRVEVRFYTSVSSDNNSAPLRPVLRQNYPNPINGQTVVPYYLPKDGPVTFEVYSLTGRRLAILASVETVAGPHNLVFDAQAFASGAYIIRLLTPGYSQSIMCHLLK